MRINSLPSAGNALTKTIPSSCKPSYRLLLKAFRQISIKKPCLFFSPAPQRLAGLGLNFRFKFSLESA